MPHARERFARWFESTGKTREAVGEELKCSGAFVGYLLSGSRDRPGLDLAFRIERATATWDEGPILAKEWSAEWSTESPAAEAN